MTKLQNIRFAVLGCGHIGKRHIADINLNPRAELIAVCDSKSSNKYILLDLRLVTILKSRELSPSRDQFSYSI